MLPLAAISRIAFVSDYQFRLELFVVAILLDLKYKLQSDILMSELHNFEHM